MSQETPAYPLLRVEHVSKSFGGVQALRDVGLDIKAAEVHAVVGENGAGKSTLMKIIAGVLRPDSGKLLLRGQPVELTDPLEAQRLGISIVFQELNLFPDLTVAENIFLNHEPTFSVGLTDYRTMHERSRQALKLVGIEIDPRRSVRALSLAEKQLVEIARGLAHRASLIILDEPNSALTVQETERLFEIIRSLVSQSTAILYVSHRMEEVFTIADRISVIRDGRNAGSWPKGETSIRQIIQAMIGRKLEEEFPPPLHALEPETPPVVEVQGLCKQGMLQPTNFVLRPGEILGVVGLEGAGKEALFQLLFGLQKPDGGTVTVAGRRATAHSPAEAIEAGWAMVPASRGEQGLMTDWSIRENVTLLILDKLRARAGLISGRKARTETESFIRTLAIVTDSQEKKVSQLSGGNQQKIVVAKWLAPRPRMLILDDPTRGVDVGAKRELYTIIRRLAADGLPILLSSSEIDEVLGLADRVMIMYRGRAVAVMPRQEIDREEVLRLVNQGIKHEPSPEQAPA
jgi:ABC-type sugar transport system ATPase subunit